MPLERFEIHLPPEFDPETGEANPDCCDQFGKPWPHYIPHQGELTGSLIETTDMLLEGRAENRYGESYKPLPIPLGSVEQHLVAPIIIDFPLQYLRFVRWRTFPDNPDAPGVKINFALAYGEFELYGRGFAGQTRYVSHIQDLGQPATLGRVFMAVSKWRRQGAGWSETADGERRWQVGELVEAPDAEVDVVFPPQERHGRRSPDVFYLERPRRIGRDQASRVGRTQVAGQRQRPELRGLAGACH